MSIKVRYEKKKPLITAEGRIYVESLLSEQNIKLTLPVHEWIYLKDFFEREEKIENYPEFLKEEIIANKSYPFRIEPNLKIFVDAVFEKIDNTAWNTSTKEASIQERPPWNLTEKLIFSMLKVFSALFYEVVDSHIIDFQNLPESDLLIDSLNTTAYIMQRYFYHWCKNHININPFWTEKEHIYSDESFHVTYIRDGRKILRTGKDLIGILLYGIQILSQGRENNIVTMEEIDFLNVFQPAFVCTQTSEKNIYMGSSITFHEIETGSTITPKELLVSRLTELGKKYYNLFLNKFPELRNF